MVRKKLTQLSRRERQIMDIVYRQGACTVAEVRDQIEDPPSYSSVRALLRVLEEKGVLRHRQQGPRYIFSPTVKRERAKTSALRHLMQTFFDNSTENVVATLMDLSSSEMSDAEYRRLHKLIEQARKSDSEQ